MAQISINNLSYDYDDFFHPVFENVTLCLDTDWKLGLIGRNGKGKSTLLNLMSGELSTSSGSITYSGKMSRFPYDYHGTYTLTIDVVKECVGGLKTLEDRMEELLPRLENASSLVEEYCSIQDAYGNLGGYDMEERINKEVCLMGFGPELLEREYSMLSGGEKTCMLIVALFLRRESFVLLDEPTNHLDVDKKDILANYLNGKRGFIIATHDFGFLDQTVDHILAINKCDITLERGNYSTWKKNVEQREAYERKCEEKLMDQIAYLEGKAEQARDWAAISNTQKYHFKSNARTNGSQAYMRQAKRAEQKMIDDIEAKKLLLRNLEEEKILHIIQNNSLEECLIHIDNFSFGYTKEKVLFEKLLLNVYPHDRVWVRGRNGAGKSTLLKLIAGEIDTKAIEYSEDIRIAYVSQEPKYFRGMISNVLASLDKMNEEKFRECCDRFDIPEDFYDRPIETLSSGEQRKLEIAIAICCANDVIILDEPLNYMDYMFRKQLQDTLVAQNITVIFVEHDRSFGQAVATKVVYL